MQEPFCLMSCSVQSEMARFHILSLQCHVFFVALGFLCAQSAFVHLHLQAELEVSHRVRVDMTTMAIRAEC